MKNKTTNHIKENNISDIEESIQAINDQLRLLFIEQHKLQTALKHNNIKTQSPGWERQRIKELHQESAIEFV